MKSFLIQEHALLMFLILPFAQVFGNVEKTIFLGPETKNNWPRDYPSSSDFHLDELSPSHPSIRRQLKASFSSAEHSSKGTETWLLLKRLEPGQRYEVRICWSATQPTIFSVFTYTPGTVFTSTSLNSSLYTYAQSRATIESGTGNILPKSETPPSAPASFAQFSGLILRIIAEADYYTTNETLMSNVPLVNADIILDPYALNVLPHSLIPTAAYILSLTGVAWLLSGIVWRWLDSISKSDLENHHSSTASKGAKSKKAD